MSTHSFTPVLEPKTQAFVDSLDAAGGPPLYTLTPDAARALLADAQAAPIEKLPADIEDTTFPVGPTGSDAKPYTGMMGNVEKNLRALGKIG